MLLRKVNFYPKRPLGQTFWQLTIPTAPLLKSVIALKKISHWRSCMYCLKQKLLSLTILCSIAILPLTFTQLSAEEMGAQHTNEQVAHGGGGGHGGGGFHGGGGGYHGGGGGWDHGGGYHGGGWDHGGGWNHGGYDHHHGWDNGGWYGGYYGVGLGIGGVGVGVDAYPYYNNYYNTYPQNYYYTDPNTTGNYYYYQQQQQ